MKIEQNVAYWCKTEELAKEFLQECEQQGYRWWGTCSTTVKTSCFEIYKSNTCYRLDIPTNSIFHSSIGWYRDEGYKIVEYKGKQEYPTIKEHMVKGNKVVVRLSNGNVGISYFNPEDEFDVGIGTKLAVERAYGVENERYVKVIDVGYTYNCYWEFVTNCFNSYANNFVYDILPTNNKIYKYIGQRKQQYWKKMIFLIQDIDTEQVFIIDEQGCEFVDKPKEKFVPYLQRKLAKFGNIGEETDIVDILGNKLCVGDTVIVYLNKKKYDERVICKDTYNGFVIGWKLTEFVNGCSDGFCGRCCIIKNRSYEEVKNGEIVHNIKYVLEDNQ